MWLAAAAECALLVLHQRKTLDAARLEQSAKHKTRDPHLSSVESLHPRGHHPRLELRIRRNRQGELIPGDRQRTVWLLRRRHWHGLRCNGRCLRQLGDFASAAGDRCRQGEPSAKRKDRSASPRHHCHLTGPHWPKETSFAVGLKINRLAARS